MRELTRSAKSANLPAEPVPAKNPWTRHLTAAAAFGAALLFIALPAGAAVRTASPTPAPAGQGPPLLVPASPAVSLGTDSSASASVSAHLATRGPSRRRHRHRHVKVAAPAKTSPPTPLGGVWARLRSCESAGNYRMDSGNGYYGAYQFSLSTWYAVGGNGRPDQSPPAAQDAAAQRLLARSGWRAWPTCSIRLGL